MIHEGDLDPMGLAREAFEDGRIAFHNGLSSDENEYIGEDQDQVDAWKAGWDCGMEERR